MAHLLRCTCGSCKLPYGKIYNGVLLVDSVHRGRKHTNSIAISVLKQLMKVDYQLALFNDLPRILPTVQLRKVIHNGLPVDAMALMCHDPGCGLPWAFVVDGVLRIESDHGITHVNHLYHNGVDQVHESHAGIFSLRMVIPI